VNLILIPSPEDAALEIGIEEIWGREIVISNVPMREMDAKSFDAIRDND
jgi:hypothetical protein